MLSLRYVVVTLGCGTPDFERIRTHLRMSLDDELVVFDNPLGFPGHPAQAEFTVQRSAIRDIAFFSSVNLGYFEAVRQAMRLAESESDEDHDWIIISNPDVRVVSVPPLSETLEQIDPEFPVVGPTPDDGERWWEPRDYSSVELWLRSTTLGLFLASTFRDRFCASVFNSHYQNRLKPTQEAPDNGARNVFMVNGCIFAIRPAMLHEIFRAYRFPFLYAEEIILAEFLRGRKLGAIMIGTWRATHTGGTSRLALAAEIGGKSVRRISRAARRDGFQTVLAMRRNREAR